MAQPLPYALEISPESALQFTITRDPATNEGGDGGASRCVMTLRHTGLTNQHLAFKVGAPSRGLDVQNEKDEKRS